MATLHAVLDAGRVAHVAVLEDDQPLVVPLAYTRDAGRLLVHGSTASRALRWLATGAPTCVTVSLLDGYVLARAAAEVSMRYRSAMVMGSFTRVTGVEASTDALRLLSEHSVPGRWADLRPPTRKELAGTLVLEMPLQEWSVKINDGWPTDEPEDRSLPVWAGVVPVVADLGQPEPDPAGLVETNPPAYLEQIPRPGLHA